MHIHKKFDMYVNLRIHICNPLICFVHGAIWYIDFYMNQYIKLSYEGTRVHDRPYRAVAATITIVTSTCMYQNDNWRSWWSEAWPEGNTL